MAWDGLHNTISDSSSSIPTNLGPCAQAAHIEINENDQSH